MSLDVRRTPAPGYPPSVPVSCCNRAVEQSSIARHCCSLCLSIFCRRLESHLFCLLTFLFRFLSLLSSIYCPRSDSSFWTLGAYNHHHHHLLIRRSSNTQTTQKSKEKKSLSHNITLHYCSARMTINSFEPVLLCRRPETGSGSMYICLIYNSITNS